MAERKIVKIKSTHPASQGVFVLKYEDELVDGVDEVIEDDDAKPSNKNGTPNPAKQGKSPTKHG